MALTLCLVGAALIGAAVPRVAGAAPTWRLEQPAPPAGVPFKVPLGAPGDLQFWSPNRGLLAIEGNAVVPRGLMLWNGSSWRTLSTVCGGSSDTLRVAWAGPTEWWTISEPSRPRIGNGITLCRYLDGKVVASYGTLPQSADPYRIMTSATCRTANDCWFSGPASTDPAGGRVGTFRLHWNGSSLTTAYGPQGRGASDLEAHAGEVWESAYAGPRAEDQAPPLGKLIEETPVLLRSVTASGAADAVPWTPLALPGVPADGSELLALDSDGAQLWIGGGGAASGPSAPLDGAVARPPLLARVGPGERLPTEVTPSLIGSVPLGATERAGDVAALPGSDDALVALQPFAERRSANAKARVAFVDAATGQMEITRLPASGAGRGTASRVACPAADECWMVTTAGWLFHWTDGRDLGVDAEPLLAGTITDRPNESAAQFVPDTPPVDDSLLLAPPPVEEVAPPQETVTTQTLPPLMRSIKSKLNGLTLVISFRLTRRAKIGVTGRRKGKVVARASQRWLRPGKRSVKLRLRRDRWPTKLAFSVVDPAAVAGEDPDDDAVSTALVAR